MIKIINWIILFFTLTNLNGQNKENKLEISHLTDQLYIFTTYKELNGYMFPSNGMYLVTNGGVVMFDTPWDSTQFQPLIDSISKRHNKEVILCISTHFHEDRTAGLEYLKHKGVKTYTSRQTYYLCREHNEKQPGYFFTKDTAFIIGREKFETYYPGEGHTKDNIVIWFNKEKVLYGGCLIKSTENNSLGNIADANLNEWENTIKNLTQKYPNPKYVIPGHFGWASKEGLGHTLKLLEQNKNNKP